MPYGEGLWAVLTEKELITALWFPMVVRLVPYIRSWKVYGGLACHGSAKTQRGG